MRGFLKSYARYLGLDAEDILARYDQALAEVLPAESDPEEAPPEAKAGLLGHRWVMVVAVLAVVVMLVVGTSLLRGDQDQVTPGGQLAGQDNQQEPNGGAQPGEGPDHDIQNGAEQPEPLPAAPAGLDLSLDVQERDCWMQVVVDGNQAFEGYVQAGNTKNFQGERTISILLGNAGAVHVRLNGENLGYLGDVGQVVREEFHSPDVPDGNRSS